jgi:hypothetical protein
LSDILVPLSINLPHHYKLIRLGRLSTAKPRPLKIICSSKDEAATLISEFNSARKNGLSIPDYFKLVRDKTSMERQLLRSCHINLERRSLAGEVDLIISYVNGVLKVIHRSKNSSQHLHPNKLK